MKDKLKRFMLRYCLRCGHEFKSNVKTKTPTCSKCHCHKTLLVKDIPLATALEMNVGKISENVAKIDERLTCLEQTINESIPAFRKNLLELTEYFKRLRSDHEFVKSHVPGAQAPPKALSRGRLH